jgi:hypothetical protein
MAEIEFTLDPATGRLEVHVRGIRGPGCADVARFVEELLGAPQVDRPTPEYALRTRVQPRVRPKGKA